MHINIFLCRHIFVYIDMYVLYVICSIHWGVRNGRDGFTQGLTWYFRPEESIRPWYAHVKRLPHNTHPSVYVYACICNKNWHSVQNDGKKSANVGLLGKVPEPIWYDFSPIISVFFLNHRPVRDTFVGLDWGGLGLCWKPNIFYFVFEPSPIVKPAEKSGIATATFPILDWREHYAECRRLAPVIVKTAVFIMFSD